MRKLILGAATAAMIAGSSVAQAAPMDRAAAPVSASEQLGEGSAHIWLGLLAAALLVVALIGINEQDGEDVDLPTSP